MNTEQAAARLRYIIEEQHRHEGYDAALEVLEQSLIIHTTDPAKHKAEIRRYRDQEPERVFSWRMKLHNPITAALLQPTYSALHHIKDADQVKQVVKQPNSRVMKLVNENYQRFFSEQPLEEYLFDAVSYYNKYDPNAWIGYERENTFAPSGSLEQVRIYPVEFTSDQVVDFGRDLSGRTRFLCALFLFDAETPQGQKRTGLEDYYLYYPGGIIRAVQIDEGATRPDLDLDQFELVEMFRDNKPLQFYVQYIENGSLEVPFFCAGAFDHPEYPRGTVKGLFLQESVPLLRQIIRDDHFLSVQKAVHCFPERHEFVKPCNAVNEQGEPCTRGYYGGHHDTDHVCGVCKGTGVQVVNSELSGKQLLYEDTMTADQLVDLSKLVHYVERPLDIAEMYIREVSRLSKLVFSVTYNQNDVEPAPIAKTATEVRINADAMNNKLMPVARQIENAWELAHRIAFQYYDAVQDTDVEMSYTGQLKVLTVDELIKQYKDAKDAGLPYYVLRSIQADIIRKQYRNWPEQAAEIDAFQSWKPWQDKSMEEIALILTGRAQNDFDRLLWENWESVVQYIQRQILDDEPIFHRLTYERQMEALREAVQTVTSGVVLAQDAGVDPFAEIGN